MSNLRDTGRHFEWDEEGMTAFASYRRAPGRLIIDHVESPPALRGKGTAGRLMAAVAAEARERGETITPICGYAAAWLKRSKEFSDLVA
jgi:uncharacterized protein